MLVLTDILDKMLIEFGEGYTEFIVSPDNWDKLSNELTDECPIGELEYKGLKIVKMDGIEENKIHIR
jgi:hypothetical protein